MLCVLGLACLCLHFAVCRRLPFRIKKRGTLTTNAHTSTTNIILLFSSSVQFYSHRQNDNWMNACGTLRRRPSSGCMWIWACGCSTEHFSICTRGIMMIGQPTNKHFRFSFMHRGVMSDERDSYGLCLWSWNIIVYYVYFFIQFVHLVRRFKGGFQLFRCICFSRRQCTILRCAVGKCRDTRFFSLLCSRLQMMMEKRTTTEKKTGAFV